MELCFHYELTSSFRYHKFIRSVQNNLVLKKFLLFTAEIKIRTMKQSTIIIVYLLTALPMAFSNCETSNGNYASHSVDRALFCRILNTLFL